MTTNLCRQFETIVLIIMANGIQYYLERVINFPSTQRPGGKKNLLFQGAVWSLKQQCMVLFHA